MARGPARSRRAARGPICLTTRGIFITKSRIAFDRARARFEREHCLMLRGFLSPDYLGLIQEAVAGLKFRRQVHAGFGRDLTLPRNNAAAVTVFLMNDPRLFRAIEKITRCGRLRVLSGSIRRAVAGGNVLSWHDDTQETRRVAITINLSEKVYRGGLLQIRDRTSGRTVKEIANTGAGDAVLFRVSPTLEHRNTEIIGPNPKTAFSGWFQSHGAAAEQIDPNPAAPVAKSHRNSKRVAVDATARIVAAPGTITKHSGQETILLNLKNGGVFRLNSTGAEMFELMKRPTTPLRIARAIAASYRVDVESVARDSASLFAALAHHGLINIGA